MLNSKQRSYLRSLAHSLTPLFQVGKGGIGDNLVRQTQEALEAHELIKLSVLNTCELTPRQVCDQLARLTDAEPVDAIGGRIILFRPSLNAEKRRIFIDKL